MLKLWETDVYKAEVNCEPRSDVMSSGTPKRIFQVIIRARAHYLDEGSFSGIAFVPRVYLSMIVNR